MGRCRRYWYEVVDAFLSWEEAYHRRRSGMHDRSVVEGGYVSYELCGNEIARLTMDGRMLYVRTAGWYTQTTMTRLMSIVPSTLRVHARAPHRYVEYLYVSGDGFGYLGPNDVASACYFMPAYEFLGIDMVGKRIVGLFADDLSFIGRPKRVIPYVRKPKAKADQYYRIDYYGDGTVEKVLIKDGKDLILIVPSGDFVGLKLLETNSVVDFVESSYARDKLIDVLRDDFFARIVEKISPYLVTLFPKI